MPGFRPTRWSGELAGGPEKVCRRLCGGAAVAVLEAVHGGRNDPHFPGGSFGVQGGAMVSHGKWPASKRSINSATAAVSGTTIGRHPPAGQR